MTTFSRIIRKYGDDASLYTDEGEVKECKCFIQPVMQRTSEKTFSEMTGLGMRDRSGYYGFFPEEIAADECRYVLCDGVAYDVTRAEKFKVNGKVSHWETMLRKREEIYSD